MNSIARFALILSGAVLVLALMPALSLAQLFPNLGGQRAGISALTFLKMDVSPRMAAMGGAQVAATGDPFALQWNPAAITDVEGFSAAVSNTFWVAGINHAHFSAAKPLGQLGSAGVLGFQATGLSSGAMEKRTETQPMGTGEYFYAYNFAAGLTYARTLTDRFSFGLTGKYVNETLDQYVAHTAVVDLGFMYRVDWKDLRFAVMMQSFGPNSRLSGPQILRTTGQPAELEANPAPTVFSLGLSLMPVNTEKHKLLTVAQLNHPNDNAENVRLGVEYSFRNLLFARAGYKIAVRDQPYPTAGLGIRARMGRNPLQLDYAIDPMPFLGLRQRVGISLIINQTPRTAATPSAQPSTETPVVR